MLALAALLGGRGDALARLGLRAAALFKTHALALLGTLVLASGFCLAGLGLAAAALSVGTRLADAIALPETGTFGALRLGLWTLGLAAVPVAGWLLVLLALASGIGAVLETLVMRMPPADSG